LEHEIRKSLESFGIRVRAAIDSELDGLEAGLTRAAEAAQQRARAEAESGAAEREASARAELQHRLTQQLEEARAEVEQRMGQQLEAARADAERRLSQHVEEARAAAFAEAQSTARAEAEKIAAREAETAAADAAAGRAAERDARLAAVERLLLSVRSIDAASSLRETLDALVDTAALETPRVAVLLIEGDSVRPFAYRGFNDIPPSGPIAAGGVVEACVQHGQPAFTGDAAGLKAPGFAALPESRAGFAAPLRVGSRTVAVLYADDAAGEPLDAPAAWPEALELLARHTSIHLENLTVTRAVASNSPSPFRHVPGAASRAEILSAQDDESARRYARLLVSEIKLYNEPAVRLGRERKDLRTRLHDEIERAHRVYLERIPDTIHGRDVYFERELLHTLAGGDASAL
jgi:hypothetical protein